MEPLVPRNALNKPLVVDVSRRRSRKRAAHDARRKKPTPRQFQRVRSRAPITLAKIGGSDA
jgi:hypothetical protein